MNPKYCFLTIGFCFPTIHRTYRTLHVGGLCESSPRTLRASLVLVRDLINILNTHNNNATVRHEEIECSLCVLFSINSYLNQSLSCNTLFSFLSVSGEKDKEKKHKKKLSSGNANIATLLSSPSSTAKNTSAKNTSVTTPSNTTTSPALSTQGSSNATNHSSPAKLLNSSQLSNQGIVKSEPGVPAMVNGSSGAVTADDTSVIQADTSLNASLQNGIQSGDGSLSETSEPNLPQCLPADVESCILRLKQAGNDGFAEGKCKFFNSDVNHMLLE